MAEVKAKKDLTIQIQAALDKAIEKLIAVEKARDSYLVVSGASGNIKRIPTKDL